MPFQNRQDAYDWLDSHQPQGPCGLMVEGGGFSHLFVLERGQDLLYQGMLRRDGDRTQAPRQRVQ